MNKPFVVKIMLSCVFVSTPNDFVGCITKEVYTFTKVSAGSCYKKTWKNVGE